MLSLRNRTCVFAGGTGDIGKKAVEFMLKGGMNVGLLTHNRKQADEIVREFEGLEGKCFVLDDSDGREEAFRKACEQFGSIDVFISKTGQLENPVSLEEINPEDLNKVFNHQVTSVFKGIKDVLPYLRKSANGRIILFSNVGSLNGFTKENLIDNIVRASVNSMVYSLSQILAEDRITVNAICFSGMIQDHEGHGLDSHSYLEKIPLKRIGTSEEIGALIEYLVSEESGYMTGEIIRLSGGLGFGL